VSDSALLRPGVAVGQYPQSADIRDTALDRIAASAAGRVHQVMGTRSPDFAGFVAAVNTQAAGLDELDDAGMSERIHAVRRNLYGEGLQDEWIAEAFALVREIATRRLNMRHYDTQLFGGRVMLEGLLAEMETGEGKTLTATLPACTAALAGIPVHIVTVNDFLVARDARWMSPIYKAFGLTVGTITEGMSLEDRRTAYACDITYCTNKQLVFDYLKDQLLLGQEKRRLHTQIESLYNDRPRTSKLLMRGLCFAIVDEADSVLIDEARTPLIISNQGDTVQEESTYREAIELAKRLTAPLDYTIRQRDKNITITDFGRAQITRLAKPLGGVWSGKRRREELIRQALSALHLYELDKHYLLKDGQVQIIDEYTGRAMPDRSWEQGLHQMIETKEGYAVTGRNETLARISYQKFFRRYLRLGGMTGTAQEVSHELWSVYRLGVVRVPTNRPLQRTSLPEELYATTDGKWRAIVKHIRALHAQGRPVLVGTRSVAASEHLSSLLTMSLLPHDVLNARQDQEEAQIVSQAGQHGRITVATNMAGRGTDIRLAPGVAELGGLHVLATERHEAGRIDRQLFGRAGRQGDPGSFQIVLSLEDELITDCYNDWQFKLLKPWLHDKGPLPAKISQLIIKYAQFSAERHHSGIRGDLMRMDESLGDMLAFAGRTE
jgi:preprotein translocase subunit SecA